MALFGAFVFPSYIHHVDSMGFMDGHDRGARFRKAFVLRARLPGPAAALLAGRGGAPAAFAGACTEWTFKERDARACAYAEHNRPK